MELIEAMLEETSSESLQLAKQIADTLDRDAVCSTICDFYCLKDDPKVQEVHFHDDAERGLFRAYHILKRLHDYGKDIPQLRGLTTNIVHVDV